MKQLDTKTFKRLNLLLIPEIIVVAIIFLDGMFDLRTGVFNWGSPVMMGIFGIYFIAFNVVAIRQKCWGSLICIWIVSILFYLNMTDLLVNLLFGETDY